MFSRIAILSIGPFNAHAGGQIKLTKDGNVLLREMVGGSFSSIPLSPPR